MQNYNKEVEYIASHYREGHFAVEPALKRIRPFNGRWWTPSRIAAASAAIAIITATATIFVNKTLFTEKGMEPAKTQTVPMSRDAVVRVIDFEDTPLPTVLNKIKETYGVEVENLPENADSYRLSLHYEGSADELVETINDILETNLIIKR